MIIFNNMAIRTKVGYTTLLMATLILLGVGYEHASRSIASSKDEEAEASALIMVWRVTNYYQIKGKLPSVLSDTTKIFGDSPIDPDLRAHLSYQKINKHEFSICVYFNSPSHDFAKLGNQVKYGDPLVHGYGSWAHGKGRQCVKRNIRKFSFPSYEEWKHARK